MLKYLLLLQSKCQNEKKENIEKENRIFRDERKVISSW